MFDNKICISNIDDILVCAENKEQHHKNFKIVQRRLCEYDLEENVAKRIICQESVKFLGYEMCYKRHKTNL